MSNVVSPLTPEQQSPTTQQRENETADGAPAAAGGGASAATVDEHTAAALGAAFTQLERDAITALDARDIATDGSSVDCQLLDRWNFFQANPLSAARSLNAGDALYGFKCFVGDVADAEDVRLLTPVLNRSSFADEVRENNVPTVNASDPDDMKKYTIIVSKAMYLLPGLQVEDVDAAHWASRRYCEACIANATFEDTTEERTFRMHKPVVRFIYSILIQLRITEITDPKAIRELASVDGFVPARALLYERTKRDKSKTDMTVKAKAVLLFQPVPGGMLVSNVAVVLNSAIPRMIAAVINNFSSNGQNETAEVVSRTRKYIKETFGSRQ